MALRRDEPRPLLSENAIQASLLAATTDDAGALNRIYNVAVGERTMLNELFETRPRYDEFREIGVCHSRNLTHRA